METRNCLARLERDGENVHAMLRDPMVVTYIDRDNRHAQEVSAAQSPPEC